MRVPAALMLGLSLWCCNAGDDRQFVTVATHLPIPAGVTKLRAPVPLRTPSDNNEVCLTPELPYRFDSDRFALVGSTGDPVVLRVSASNRQSTVELAGRVSYGEDLCFAADVGADIGGPFDTIQIDSSSELRLAKVEWHST